MAAAATPSVPRQTVRRIGPHTVRGVKPMLTDEDQQYLQVHLEARRCPQRGPATDHTAHILANNPAWAPKNQRRGDEGEQVPEALRSADEWTLKVDGMGEEVRKGMIEDHFGAFPSLKQVQMQVNASTGRCRGYAFVTFADAGDMLAAQAAKDGTRIGSKQIRVEVSNATKSGDRTAGKRIKGVAERKAQAKKATCGTGKK